MIIKRRTALLLAVAAVALVVLPLMFAHGNFGGSDDAGSAAIAASNPGFKRWFTPIWTPPSAEIESLLFALQAALGAGVIGYVLGRIHGGRASGHTTDHEPADVDHRRQRQS